MDWWTTELRTFAHDRYKNMQQYYFRHTAPGGAFHRFDHVLPKPDRFFDFSNPYRANPVCDNGCGVLNRTRHLVIKGVYEPWTLAIIDRVYGAASGPRPVANNSASASIAARRAALYDGAQELLSDTPADLSVIDGYRSDVMPYAGLFYQRSGWSRGDSLLHCIATPGKGFTAFGVDTIDFDPVNSAGVTETHTAWFEVPGSCAFTLSGKNQLLQAVLLPLAKLIALRVNGDSPLPMFHTKGLHPGSKTTSLSHASDVPVLGRFFSGANLDLTEPVYTGPYATATSKIIATKFGHLTGTQETVAFPTRFIEGNCSRVFVSVPRYLATFSIETFASRAKSPQLTSTVVLQLPTVDGKVDASRLKVSAAGLHSNNAAANQANFDYYFTSRAKLTVKAGKASKPSVMYSELFAKPTGVVDVAVEITRNSTAPLLSLFYPTHLGEQSALAATTRPKGDGIDAVASDGGKLCLRSPHRSAASCFKLPLHCDSLVAWCVPTSSGEYAARGSDAACATRVEGVAMGCANAGVRDFAFNRTSAGGIVKTSIGRALHKPTINGAGPVIYELAKVSLTSPEFAAGTAHIRYSTDGSDPSSNSTLYDPASLGIIVDKTMLLKAVAFCAPGHCPGKRPTFASDGTRFSAIAYSQFTLTTPRAAKLATGPLQRGLCSWRKSDPSWSLLYATAGSKLGFGGAGGTGGPVATPDAGIKAAKPCTTAQVMYTQLLIEGYFNASRSGAYAFWAPEEYRTPNALLMSAGYDLRLYLNGDEVPLWQMPGGGAGAWHASLAQGQHEFAIVFTDGRCRTASGASAAGSFYGLWRDYPQPWSTWDGQPSALTFTAPGETARKPLTSDLFSRRSGACD